MKRFYYLCFALLTTLLIGIGQSDVSISSDTNASLQTEIRGVWLTT